MMKLTGIAAVKNVIVIESCCCGLILVDFLVRNSAVDAAVDTSLAVSLLLL